VQDRDRRAVAVFRRGERYGHVSPHRVSPISNAFTLLEEIEYY
jgi:hypothetical protein